jgi:hypothetical protein
MFCNFFALNQMAVKANTNELAQRNKSKSVFHGNHKKFDFLKQDPEKTVQTELKSRMLNLLGMVETLMKDLIEKKKTNFEGKKTR